MKGTFRVVRADQKRDGKTNFDDWSDPNCKKCSKENQIHDSKEETSKSNYGNKMYDFPDKIQPQCSQTSIFIEHLRNKIQEGYPLLSWKEIRNYKLPFHKSLVDNLKEEGFTGTSSFIKSLIEIDDQWHELFGEKNDVQFLKSNKTALKLLSEKLVIAEVAHLEKDRSTELKSMLETALFFANSNHRCWQWLAEEFFEQSVAICEESEITGSTLQLEAIGKYLYAKFTLDVLKDTNKAKVLVEKSMELSNGQFWRSEELTGQNSDILYLDSCLLLHKIFLIMTEDMRTVDISKALQLCKSSLFWARQVGSKEAEGAALMKLALICLEAKEYDLTLDYLNMYMNNCVDLNDILGLCEGLILKAKYHKCTHNHQSVISDFLDLLQLAEDHSIIKMMAIAHHKLAITYLMRGNEKEMQIHALKAYNYYVSLDAAAQIDEAKCLTGIGQAQEIMPQYIDLLLEADDINYAEFEIFMLWKRLHIPFFSDVKPFQPEGEINQSLIERIDIMKDEEWVNAYKTRQVHSASISLSYMPSKFQLKSSATETQIRTNFNKSVLNVRSLQQKPKESNKSSMFFTHF